MAKKIKMRARYKDGITTVKVLMLHPMETGRRKAADGTRVPAHFIQLVSAKWNSQVVLESQWGTGISKNPYLTFQLNQAKVGDTIEVSWQDNLGELAHHSVKVT